MEEKTKQELLEELTKVYEEMELAIDNLKQKQADYFVAQRAIFDYDKRNENVPSK